MLNYVTVGSNRLEEAKPFYDALLVLAGMTPMVEHPSGGRVYAAPDQRMFAVVGPFDGEAATVGNGAMIGFTFDTRAKVADFHAKAVALGGTCEGAPGLRGPEEIGAYFAYFRDLDGNKFCAYRIGAE
ncbi:Catechol 2,3-dioxygenase [Sphingomonas laterariae]|uniref:Catechol 2,3-dioxygenase n=1 Tax=Edaphosphingomonas laterariae TaxID=861865 RepID=A0A239C9W0_9SPHN|nr:VOC family protein [Sphingomonas laterariae]SNS16133.1 Catechol 2,3-dioxygenase [Sphingomonas laterariae]